MDTTDDEVPEQEALPPGGDLLRCLLDKEPAFRSFVRQRINDPAVAEDLLQDAFVRAVAQQHTVRDEESVVPWFYRVLRHTIVDYYRSRGAQSRRDEAFLQDLTQREEDKVPSLEVLIPTVCHCLHGLLPALRSNYRELLRRIDLEGEDPAQVARELNITLNNLTVRLHRARQALRGSLEQACGVCSTHGCLNCSCD